MEENKNNIESLKEQKTFKNMKVNYAKSKEDIWAQLEEKVASAKQPSSIQKTIKLPYLKWSVAAVLFITIGLGLFARLHTVHLNVSKGEFATHVLPDGSQVFLNAQSSISYTPYWWSFDRQVNLEGEAFFEVAKGEKFTVNSKLGQTEVLGTSFNIYSRDQDYTVYCSTGKVKVSDQRGESVLLTPGSFTEVNNDKLAVSTKTETEALSWRLNKFVYNTTSLDKVFSDLERQYNITIAAKKQIRRKVYTGVFDRTVSFKEALNIICLSFDLNFEETSSETFHVY
jgi:transmembrane sensor